ncbi:MAG TPA: MmgE/PrpD family protein [Xanthobacteraceae bacterium]|jgi:2-methylcitrate dehydratase PrpD|nr:MmgE/PrpD family protein [Xanthobacteraceae bacterium]
MAHAEALQTLDPVGPTTAALVEFVSELRYATIPDEARHYARRHLLDTVGVMIAGAAGDVASRAEAVLATVRPAGRIPVPGRARRADLIDAAFLGGTAAHGIELDDGFRQGSVHPGCVVVPTALALGCARRSNGQALMQAIVAGYETVIAIGRACHPDLRQRGFHPTAAVGVFGSAAAAGKLGALSAVRLANAFGLAASSAGGLFAFVNGGGDIKRLHAGHAAREGLQAALLAAQGVEGPPGVLEARDGFLQAFARAEKARAIVLPPPFGITDCYIKPYPCCRHIQPAVEALIGLVNDENIAGDDVERIEVATYRIAAEHAETGWEDFASAQLSFPYLIGLALKFRAIKLEHFADAVRRDPAFAAIARKLTVTAPADVDRLYPQLRPARVTVTTARGSFTRQADEALGSRIVPLDDAALKAKFLDLVGPELGTARAKELAEQLWSIDAISDVAPLVEAMAKPA